MSLSMPQVQLGNWGTLGYLGQHLKPGSPHSVFAHFFIRIQSVDFQECIAQATAALVQEHFGNCTSLGLVNDDIRGITFNWELGSLVRDTQRLLRAAAKRLRGAGQIGKQTGQQAIDENRRRFDESCSGNQAVMQTLSMVQGVLKRLKSDESRSVNNTTSFSGTPLSGHISHVPEGVVLRIWPNGMLHGSGVEQEIFISANLVHHIVGILKHQR